MARPVIKDLQVVVTPRESGLPENFCYNAIRRGDLKALWTGRGYLIPLTALHEFLDRVSTTEARERARKARQAEVLGVANVT